MAVSLSNYTLLAPPRLSASFSSKPSKTLETKTPSPLHQMPLRLCKPINASLPSSSSPIPINNVKRRSLKTYLAPEDSAPTTNGKDENIEIQEGQKRGPGLKNLMKTYRQAIFYGDEKTILDIEAKVGTIEKENHEFLQKVSSLSAEITSGKEKYIRLQADFDNFRKRSDKERVKIRSDAQGEVIESLLPMVDSFERAKQQIQPETEKEKKIDSSYQGIYKQLVDIMRNLHVAAVPTVGKPFDPSLHEAIAREESQEYKEGIIIQEFRRGFLIGNRLIRPAMVKVSSGPGNKKSSVGTEKRAEQPATAAGMD
ncbi:PREDICTED: grpE protein homolog, mitochondrial [Populus euphratica]|uniref:GrpE protein homolog n=1 Tax=Populus euphratica TaxID=75702 RepID=A0AAJ6UDZ5_POPEU|nr:PREDICTED: grpE protein homolog, mitochondrial [Populus euphratica]